MPWCGIWGTTDAAHWWILPLIGLVFMGVMLFACFRCFGGMRRRGRGPGELATLQRDVDGLKEDVRKLLRNPS